MILDFLTIFKLFLKKKTNVGVYYVYTAMYYIIYTVKNKNKKGEKIIVMSWFPKHKFGFWHKQTCTTVIS